MILTLKNFRCYENSTYDLGNNGLTLISGNSGIGKSSLFMAINFVLYGTGKKLTRYDQKTCLVSLVVKDMTITRTIKPNRLVVNTGKDQIYEDDVGQKIINNIFGEDFNIIGYIEQNTLNSFVVLSPIDKLYFLEKFAFKNIDLSDLKQRCNSHMKDCKENLTKDSAKLEISQKIFEEEYKKPDVISYPIPTKNKDKTTQNTRIRYKNCNTLIKKNISKIKEATSEYNDLINLNTKLNSNDGIISEIETKLVKIRAEKEFIKYEGDDILNSYKQNLEKIVLERDYNVLKKDCEKLTKMKENEEENMKTKIKAIQDVLWVEHDKESVDDTLTEYKQYMNDSDKFYSLSKEIELYKNISDNDLEILREELKMSKQSEVFICPKCDTNLSFEDNKLVCLKVVYNKKSCRVSSLIEKDINSLEYKLKRKSELMEKIEEIKEIYEEIPDYNEMKEMYSCLKKYKEDQTNLEKNKIVLENNLKNQIYSSSYNLFKKDIDKRMEKFKGVSDKISTECDYSEEELRDIIDREQRNLDDLKRCALKIKDFEEDIIRYTNKNAVLKNEYVKKYGIVKDEIELSNFIKECDKTNEDLERDKKKQEDILCAIEKYEKYVEENDRYQKMVDNINVLKENEKESNIKYTNVLKLKEKILETESICLSNVISSINTHVQLYLDLFFVDNPIIIELLPFKESKKAKVQPKPQINIRIDYKGMECDTNSLSGGEISRVILAFTLALGEMFNVPLIMLDETTSSLDQSLTSSVFGAIRENCKNKLVLIIAHQVVEGVFDKVIKL
jgi:DNA repair exonuclease SbcCD ATPase subunit